MTSEDTTGVGEDNAVLEVDDRLHAGDLIEDPRLDSEALCLCGLLWSGPAAARLVTDVLVPGDFIRPAHAALFAMIAAELGHGRQHDPASIIAVITSRGTGGTHQVDVLTTALAAATAAGAAPESVGHHAANVAAAAYRRSFHTAATAMAQAAEQVPTDELFDHLVAIGRAQRTATQRLHHVRTTLDGSRTA